MADDIGMFQHAISANGDQAIGTIIAELWRRSARTA